MRVETLIFHGDRKFVDSHFLTDYPTGVVAPVVRDQGFGVVVHDW